MKKFSVVVPVYQNELNLNHTIPTLMKLGEKILHRLKIETEFIFIDDGSSDGSYTILKSFKDEYPTKMIVVKLARNFGQTPAIQAGISNASGDCVGIISADLQDPPEIFIEMLESWLNGEDYIIAERVDRQEKFLHRFFSGLYWKMIARFSMDDFPKGGYDFCLFDKKIVQLLVNNQEKNSSIFPLIFWFGFKPGVIRYQRQIRSKGKSGWTLLKKFRLTLDTMIAFTYIPTRVISFSAISTSLLAFFYSVIVFLVWLFGDGSAPDGWTTIALLILIIGGVVLFGLGILSEYLLRILDEVRRRPNYVVDEIYKDDSE